MTLFVNEIAAFTDKRIRVLSVLASIFSGIRTVDGLRCYRGIYVLLAIVVHYMVGIFFAFGYALALYYDLADISLKGGALYGISIGIFAAAVWGTVFLSLPRAPIVPLRLFIPVVGLSHLPLGLMLAFSWSLG